jgi:hypothetical protein
VASTVVPVVTWTSYRVATEGLTANEYGVAPVPVGFSVTLAVAVNEVVPNGSASSVATSSICAPVTPPLTVATS